MSEVSSEAKKEAAAEYQQPAEIVDLPLKRREKPPTTIDPSVLNSAFHKKRFEITTDQNLTEDERETESLINTELQGRATKDGVVDPSMIKDIDASYSKKIVEKETLVGRLEKNIQALKEDVAKYSEMSTPEGADARKSFATDRASAAQKSLRKLESYSNLNGQQLQDRYDLNNILTSEKRISEMSTEEIITMAETKMKDRQQELDQTEVNRDRESTNLADLKNQSEEYKERLRVDPYLREKVRLDIRERELNSELDTLNEAEQYAHGMTRPDVRKAITKEDVAKFDKMLEEVRARKNEIQSALQRDVFIPREIITTKEMPLKGEKPSAQEEKKADNAEAVTKETDLERAIREAMEAGDESIQEEQNPPSLDRQMERADKQSTGVAQGERLPVFNLSDVTPPPVPKIPTQPPQQSGFKRFFDRLRGTKKAS